MEQSGSSLWKTETAETADAEFLHQLLKKPFFLQMDLK